MAKRIFFIWIILLVICSDFLFAQSGYIMNGSVYDQNEILVGANIRLINTKRTKQTFGTITDANGKFSLAIAKGNYRLEISYIGYITYTTNVEIDGNVNLPPITLNEDTQLLDEVVVTARTITYNANGYVAEISKNAFYRNKDLSNILRLTPGTNVSAQGIEAYGGSISKVYINGRELKLRGEQLVNYLQTIEGKNVKEMEVITMSGVEDDASSAGQAILKITTINPETGGLINIGGNAGLRMNSQLYGGSINTQWRINEHWGIYTTLLGQNAQDTNGMMTNTIFYDTSERRSNEMEDNTKRNNYMATLGITYDLDANNLFSLEGNYTTTRGNNSQWNETCYWENNHYDIIANGTANGKRDFNNFNISFLYLHKLGKNSDLTLKVESFKNKVDENEIQHFIYTANSRGNNRLNKEDNQLYTLKADYTHKLSFVKGKFSAGIKMNWLVNDNFTDYESLTNGNSNLVETYTDCYKYSENIYAFYAKYSFELKKINLNVGLRMERSNLYPQSATNPERNEKSYYNDLFPEIGISYAINKDKGHNTAFSYSKKINRPSMASLNPLVRCINEYNYSMGNPSLKPYYTYNLSWTTHLFHKYIIRLSYDISKNGTINIGENKNGVIYSTSYNGNEYSKLRAYVNIPIPIGDHVRISFSGGYSYSVTSYKGDKKENNNWNIGFSGMFSLPIGIDVITDFQYSPPSQSLYSKTYRRPYANLIISKSFLKEKLNLTLLAGDLFDQFASVRSEYCNDNYWQETKGSRKDYGAVLNVRYNLRWGRKTNVRKAGISSDSGRFGAE